MAGQKIIFISGAKQSGKTSAVNYLTGFLLKQNKVIDHFELDADGNLLIDITVIDPSTGKEVRELGHLDIFRKDPEYGRDASKKIWPLIKPYNFADFLKEIAIVVFGLSRDGVYGTNEQKNSDSPIKWTDMYKLCPKLKKANRPEFMTNREFLEIFGTDVCRSIKNLCWIESTVAQIVNEDWPLAVVADCRFVDEVEYGKEIGAKTIRLTRNPLKGSHIAETSLLDYQGFDAVIDNENMTQEEKGQELIKILQGWGLL